MTIPDGTEVRHIMGTAIRITLDATAAAGAADVAFDWLHEVDRRFSTYRDTSEVSRINSGTLSLEDASADVREIIARCRQLERDTAGWFTTRPAAGATLDPSGLVKGWSVDVAAQLLRDRGIARFCIDAGGDLICRTPAETSSPWRIGIRHPDRADRLAATLRVHDRAIATSAAYERGEHIWHGPGQGPPLVSATVVGPELGTADALATAVFACGAKGLWWLRRFPAYDVFLVTAAGRARWTPGLDSLLVAA